MQNFKATTWQSLIRFERENAFFKPKDKVLIGLSGGADSVALLHFLKQLSVKKHFFIYACHVNHGLRKAAARDADFAAETAAALGAPFILKKVNIKKEGLSAEHAARKARYKAFEEAAKKYGCAKIALGHHLDDNAETILLNILRGTKAKGLAGIPVRRFAGKREIVRPFLCITRKEALNYIKEHKLAFIEDETNFDDIYTRNWVRQILLPLLEKKQPKIRQHLLAISRDLTKIMNKGDKP